MKSFLSLLCIVMISAGIAGCASPQLKKPTAVDTAENRALVDKLLEAIISSYINYSRDDFSQLVADDFLPLKTEFLNEVEKQFYSANILEINYIVEEFFKQKDKLTVIFKWEKKISPYTASEPVLLKGKAEFVFKNEGRNWLLYQVKGDNPF